MTGPVFPEDSWVQVLYPLTREQERAARGLRRMVLDATPLPTLPEVPAPGVIDPPRTKKAVLLALYRAHPDYGNRSRASRVAAELAAQARLQAGTARTYVYAELDARTS
jgi:hypothetical protein